MNDSASYFLKEPSKKIRLQNLESEESLESYWIIVQKWLREVEGGGVDLFYKQVRCSCLINSSLNSPLSNKGPG